MSGIVINMNMKGKQVAALLQVFDMMNGIQGKIGYPGTHVEAADQPVGPFLKR
ncbi:hypothetical protein [Paenibacillus mucilaginosus]|uniref:hypothetical protein n=1 Tax=Paenibacillus mucilaginosus TaxID=61624 RepID=UPI001651AE65|nr:hypothetical protein [Paenibacillus mucilaginosus]MCG7214553.1 hypothetical protein [Paenibacillus mucilaginosus]WDM30832.1 hypothetical protein KCX80_17455 [Paenibacillus mucilaginosus]